MVLRKDQDLEQKYHDEIKNEKDSNTVNSILHIKQNYIRCKITNRRIQKWINISFFICFLLGNLFSFSTPSLYCNGFQHRFQFTSFSKIDRHYVPSHNQFPRQSIYNTYEKRIKSSSQINLSYNNQNKKNAASQDSNPHWYPKSILQQYSNSSNETNIENVKKDSKYNEELANLEELSVDFLAQQIIAKLLSSSQPHKSDKKTNKRAAKLAKGHFLGLVHGAENEILLEQLISVNIPPEFLEIYNSNKPISTSQSKIKQKNELYTFDNIIKGSIMTLQSLLIYGMQLGVKGSQFMQNKMVAHLRPNEQECNQKINSSNNPSDDTWTNEDIKKLKYDRNTKAAIQLLAALKKKQSAQGAFDLLVSLGIWKHHENLDFLRSGFPTRFTNEEEMAARLASTSTHDPDRLLNIRKDLRRLKVYTIDNASTNEIDDGISVEVLPDNTNSDTVRQRYWIHIADADRWAPRGSKVIEAAQRRATSIYLPTGSYHMFPPQISLKCMSLNANFDSYALSLGVELNPDGSINEKSIVITPSLIRVSYRLTYDEVDEMLEEGVGYSEEWQLGALLAAATKRRKYRSMNGSNEGMIPNPIPQGSISVQLANNEILSEQSNGDEFEGQNEVASISINVESTHNAGFNITSNADQSIQESPTSAYAAPVSPANLLVTEMMILGGEAIGKWGLICNEKEKKDSEKRKDQTNESNDSSQHVDLLTNELKLPFRGQPKPDFLSRERETNFLAHLKEQNAGNGYCAAWYSRRFFNPVVVSEKPNRHSGMGLDCYVQWSSPIRRYGDLQVHAAVKRYLRRERINELLKAGIDIPPGITSTDLGCSLPKLDLNIKSNELSNNHKIESPIDFNDGMALFRAGRPLQRNAQQYWMFEYIRRLVLQNPNEEVAFECVVLGCIDTERDLYVIYVYELGLEHKYLSEIGMLDPGHTLWLKVKSVNPRMRFLAFTVASSDAGSKKNIITAKAA